jgi:hypothetical protein
LSVGVWYFIVFRYSNTTDELSLTVNGSKTSQTYDRPSHQTGQALRVGGRNAVGTVFPGTIDSMSIWSRSLSDSEVAATYLEDFPFESYASCRKRSPSLVATSPLPNTVLPPGYAKQLLRTIEQYDDRPAQSLLLQDLSGFPKSRGYVWQPVIPRDETSNRAPWVVPAPKSVYGQGYVKFIGLIEDVDRTEPTIIQLAPNFVPGGYAKFVGEATEPALQPKTFQRTVTILSNGNPMSSVLGTYGYLSEGSRSPAPMSAADYYWRAGIPTTGWNLSLVGSDSCESPWSVRLSEGWTFGDLEQ